MDHENVAQLASRRFDAIPSLEEEVSVANAGNVRVINPVVTAVIELVALAIQCAPPRK
jgi:hypothetical protein